MDLGYFFRTKWLIATLIALSLSDMLVVGLVYTHMMTFDYFDFYIPGVIIAGMYTAALDVGRRMHLGLSQGVSQYYLSLPVGLETLAWAHVISAGLGGTIYSGVLLIVAVALLPKLASLATLTVLPFIFIVSMGLGGIAALLNLLTGGGDRYWVFADGVQTLLLGLSTIFYPIATIQALFPRFLTDIVEVNPLSQIADALRTAALSQGSLSPLTFGEILVTSLIMLSVGWAGYRHVFSKLQHVGKID